MQESILSVRGLVASFATDAGRVRAVDGVSFELGRGQTLGVVGESGCGKSVTSLSIMRLLPRPSGRIDAGEVVYRGENLVAMRPEELHRIRGHKISMIFQEPMTALNPVKKIGRQLGEVFELHFPELSSSEIKKRSLEMLERVGISEPARRLSEYPHQLSGGMRQRVMIAIALACEPDILIADEPTTALDVTIQAQILELMKSLQASTGMAILFITHDLGVIAELCDEVVVMYGGRVVEQASVTELFEAPRHPYTQGLLASIPRLDHPRKTRLKTIEGMVPPLTDMPPGCRFQNRCGFRTSLCETTEPAAETVGAGHLVRCHHWQRAATESPVRERPTRDAKERSR